MQKTDCGEKKDDGFVGAITACIVIVCLMFGFVFTFAILDKQTAHSEQEKKSETASVDTTGSSHVDTSGIGILNSKINYDAWRKVEFSKRVFSKIKKITETKDFISIEFVLVGDETQKGA